MQGSLMSQKYMKFKQRGLMLLGAEIEHWGLAMAVGNINHAPLTMTALCWLKEGHSDLAGRCTPGNLGVNLGSGPSHPRAAISMGRLATLVPKQWGPPSLHGLLPLPSLPTSPCDPGPACTTAGLWGAAEQI